MTATEVDCCVFGFGAAAVPASALFKPGTDGEGLCFLRQGRDMGREGYVCLKPVGLLDFEPNQLDEQVKPNFSRQIVCHAFALQLNGKCRMHTLPQVGFETLRQKTHLGMKCFNAHCKILQNKSPLLCPKTGTKCT